MVWFACNADFCIRQIYINCQHSRQEFGWTSVFLCVLLLRSLNTVQNVHTHKYIPWKAAEDTSFFLYSFQHHLPSDVTQLWTRERWFVSSWGGSVQRNQSVGQDQGLSFFRVSQILQQPGISSSCVLLHCTWTVLILQ